LATSNKNFKVKNGLDVNGEITAAAVGGDEGGQLNLAKPQTNTTLSGDIAIDIHQNKLRIFDKGGSNRGAYIDLTTAATGVGTNLLAGGGGDFVARAGDSMTGALTLSGAPTTNLHAATKSYVDTSIYNLGTALELADDGIMGDITTINNSITSINTSKQDKVTNISDTEIGYLDGVTSSIQTQLNAKASSSSPNITNPTIIYDSGSGVSSTIAPVEISYLDGVTSSIQTQIDTKAPAASPTFTGNVLLPTTTTIGDVSSAEVGHLNGVTSAIQAQIDAKLSSSTAAGIYAPLNDPTFGGTVSLPGTTSIGDVSSTEIGYLNGTTSSVQTQLTSLDTSKAPKENPTFTGTVSGVTKTHVGLANVDNTSDASKPISTATQTALDAKASLSGATFTANVEVDGNLVVDGNLTVNGTEFIASATSITIEDNLVQIAHQNAANTVDLGLVVGYNDGTAQHAGIVRDVSANTWKLFKGVETEPATTVAFGEGSLDDLELNNVKAAGVVFTDGTQTKVGVPSLTTFTEKTADYTLDTLAHQDSVIEMNSTSPTIFTIPTNATLAWPIGASMDIFQTNTGEVTIAAAVGVTLNRTPGNKLRTQWSSATILKRGTDNWILYGDLKA
jgi:hypothetical protein